MSLDARVAQAVMHVAFVEKALHDAGPWTIRIDGFELPLVIVPQDDGVLLWTALPEALEPGSYVAEVICAGDLLRAVSVDLRGGGGYLDIEVGLSWEHQEA